MYLLTTTENKIEEIEKILDKVKPLTESIARQEFNHGCEVTRNSVCNEFIEEAKRVYFDNATVIRCIELLAEKIKNRG